MKKKILSLFLCLVLCLSLLPTVAFADGTTYTGTGTGSGTESDPWKISTLAQLNDLADAVNGEGDYAGNPSNMSGKYFKLTADIGSETDRFTKIIGKDRNDGQPHFSGNFDGDGHYVWLTINKEDSSASDMYVGMFVLSRAKISNLTVKGTVKAKNTGSNGRGVHVGGIAGTDIYSTFNYCRSECTVTAEKAGSSGDTIAGGICGVSTSNTFVNCSSSGSVTAKAGQNAVAGGITGTIGTNVKNSFSDAAVTASDATNNYAGGIVGYNSGDGTIIANCYYSGSSVSGGTNTTGGVCGGVKNGTATITNSYYDSTVLTGKKAVGGTTDTDKVKGLPTTDMQAASGTTGALVDLLNGYVKSPENTYPTEFKKWTVTSGSYPLFEGMTPPVTPPVTPTKYYIYVNNEQFTSEHLTINCGSGTATLDPTTTPYTLTLTNANITNAHEESYASAAVFTENALKVVLVGTNTINVTGTNDSGFYMEDADLTLEGSGSLTVSAKGSGIYMSGTAAKTVTLGGSGKLEIKGFSDGIYALKGVTVVFSNTNSTPVSIVSSDQCGIWSVNGDITLSGTGDANIHALNTAVYVNNTGDVTFSGSGNIALEGGHGVDSSANGIYVQNGDVKFTGNGGQVSVEGDGDAIYLGTSGKKVVLSGTASPITLTAGAGCCAVRNSVDSTGVVNDTNNAYNVTGAPNTPSAVYTLKGSTYTVTVQNDGHGTASASPTSAAKNATVTLTATPNTGYHFKEWQSSDVTVSGDSFTMPEKDVTVKAIFEANALTGTVSITGSAKYGETLTASVTGTNNTGTLTYQWKRGGADISGATNSTYTLTADDIGETVTVAVSSSVETGTINSAATSAVEKADGPAVPTGLAGTACTTSENDDGKITGTTSAMEYSTDSTFASTTACTGTEITGLTNGTYYVRIAETATHKAGAAANVVINAYISDSYTVTFNANGGSVMPASAVTGTDGKLASLPTPTRYGYTFDGWYTAAWGGDEVTIEKVYTADTTIYARWTKDKPSFDPTHLFILDDEPVAKMSFRDVQRGAYYYDAVKWAVENGITTGKTSTEFDPTGAVTRAQAVTFLWRAAGCPKVNYFMKFTDLKPGAYYTEAVRWAVAMGITKGVDETHFAPDATCTRAHIVSFLYRYAKASPVGTTNPFTDVAAGAYYYDAVLWALANGITGGRTETLFAPVDICNRAQVVTFIYRYMVK